MAPTVHERRRATLALLAAAFIFGTTFTTVKRATQDVAPLPFLAVRFVIGAAVLAPFAARRPRLPGVLLAGVIAGLALSLGYITQTIGLQYTDESTSAFITYLLVVFVPLLHAVVTRTMPSRPVAVGVAVAAAGLFLLSNAGSVGAGIGRGEVLTLICALGFAIHILVLDRFAGRHDAVWMNTVQLGVVGVVCLGPGLADGGFRFPLSAWLACAYLGVVASAIAFFLQTWAQAHIEPTRASLLLMLEPVFAGLLGAVLGRALGWRGAAGACLILVGIAIVSGLGGRRSSGAVWDESAPVS